MTAFFHTNFAHIYVWLSITNFAKPFVIVYAMLQLSDWEFWYDGQQLGLGCHPIIPSDHVAMGEDRNGMATT